MRKILPRTELHGRRRKMAARAFHPADISTARLLFCLRGLSDGEHSGVQAANEIKDVSQHRLPVLLAFDAQLDRGETGYLGRGSLVCYANRFYGAVEAPEVFAVHSHWSVINIASALGPITEGYAQSPAAAESVGLREEIKQELGLTSSLGFGGHSQGQLFLTFWLCAAVRS